MCGRAITSPTPRPRSVTGTASATGSPRKIGYAQLVDQVKADFHTTDYYQGAYLINQAVNELCPAQIWQLRQSAAGYRVPA